MMKLLLSKKSFSENTFSRSLFTESGVSALLENGYFNTGIDGWVNESVGAGLFTWDSINKRAELTRGSSAADLGRMSQTLLLDSGSSYDLEFTVPSDSLTIITKINGVQQANTVAGNTSVFTFISDGSDYIQFYGGNNNNTFFIDDISVTPTPVVVDT